MGLKEAGRQGKLDRRNLRGRQEQLEVLRQAQDDELFKESLTRQSVFAKWKFGNEGKARINWREMKFSREQWDVPKRNLGTSEEKFEKERRERMKNTYIGTVMGILLVMSPQAVRATQLDDVEMLIQTHQFDAALAKFSGIPRAESDQVLILRLQGVCYLKLERYPEAEKTLRQATQADLTNVATRFYLAQTLASEGKVSDSIPLLESVLSTAPDSEYGDLSRKILPALRSLVAVTPTQATPPDGYAQDSNPVISSPEPPKRWGVTMSVAGAYDDNINENSRTPSTTSTQDGFSFVTSDELRVALLDEKIDDAPLTIRATYDFYQNVHDSSNSSFDITTHDGALSFEKTTNLGNYPTKFFASGGYRNESQGGSKFDDSYTGAGSVATTWNSWLSSTIYDSYGEYNYAGGTFFPSLFSRSGGVNRVGFYPIFSLWDGKLKLQPVYEYNSYSDGNGIGVPRERPHGGPDVARSVAVRLLIDRRIPVGERGVWGVCAGAAAGR